MYIDTRCIENLEKAVCDLFQMQPLQMYEYLMQLGQLSDGEEEYTCRLDAFIAERCMRYPDEILLFHLARRMHGSEDSKEGRNLANLLLSSNPFCTFMRDNGISFIKGELYIEVIYKGALVDWDKCTEGNPEYVKWRLGYDENEKDFCFNGFALKDLLYRNHYARALYYGPEFFQQLVDCLQCEILQQKYMENSEYFCYEYKLPIATVIFDGHDDYSESMKQQYLVRCVLQRLHKYFVSSLEFMQDDENPILRLADDYIVPAEFYVGKEKITSEMLIY